MRNYDLGLERIVLRAIAGTKGFARTIRDHHQFGEGIFADKTNKVIYSAFIKYFENNGIIPSEKVMRVYIAKYVTGESGIKIENNIDKYEVLVEKIYDKPLSKKEVDHLNSTIEALISLKRMRSVQDAILTANDYLDSGDVENSEIALLDYKVDFLSHHVTSESGDYVMDWKERFDIFNQKRLHPELFSAIPTNMYGWNPDDPFNTDKDKSRPQKFDTLLDGGHYKGELTLVIGDSGAGKSFELMEMAYQAACSGKNVAYFSIEMNKWQVSTRLDSRISGIEFKKFRMATLTKPEVIKWKTKVEQFYKKKGKIFVTGFHKGCTPATIETKAREIEQIEGMPIDIMVIDYLNDISPSMASINTSDKDWTSQGQISWDLKQMAGSWNKGDGVPVITANQGKSTSSLSKFKTSERGIVYFRRMSWNDAAFSPLPSHHAAVIIGLLHSKRQDNGVANIVNHQIIKNRFGGSHIGILTFPDLAVSKMNSKMKYLEALEHKESLSLETDSEDKDEL